MSETVNPVVELPVPSTHVLKRIAKKAAIASVAVVAVAAIYLKVTQAADEEFLNSETVEA